MKCTNRYRLLSALLIVCLLSGILTGCGQENFEFAYNADYPVSSYQVTGTVIDTKASPFASDLCVITNDVAIDGVDMSQALAAILCNADSSDVLFSKNAHNKLYPASLTKIMTALVALKYGSLDQVLTAKGSINISESGAQLCGLKVGDTMTLSQALHILLVYSANDVAMMIADNIAGSVDEFVALMNEEALALGATNTHFANPNGLSDIEHYTTAYDLYLIFNEAIKEEEIREIIHTVTYETVYYDKDGKEKKLSVNSTNLYLRGNYSGPDGITIIGGKTGTTNAAGHCLILLSKDTSGTSYVSVILGSEATEVLYAEMSDLLSKIGK